MTKLRELIGRHHGIAFLLVVLVVCALPYVGLSGFWIRQIILVAMLALVASGLNLTLGFAGELALGQAAMYAGAAYAAGYFAKTYLNDLLFALVIGAVFALLIGLVAGAPGIRLGGWMLAIGSFFLVLLTPDLVNIIGEPLGGREGLVGIPLPALFGQELTSNGFYIATVIVTACWFALFRNLIESPRGAEFRVLGAGETLSSSLGISSYRLKLKTYAIGAIPAGLAGALFAYLDGYVSATSFGLHMALMVLAAGVLGGLHTVYGAILGATLMQIGPMSSSAFQDYATVAFGLFLLVGGVFLPKGLVPIMSKLVDRVWRKAETKTLTSVAVSEFEPIDGEVLQTNDVHLAFGGVRALDGVSIEARPSRVTALIGPNGSGKTTLLNVISGYYVADQGTVTLAGQDISNRLPQQRALAGVGRTFQTPAIPAELTVRDAIRTGAISKEVGLLPTVLRLPSYRRRDANALSEVDTIMSALGIADRADEEAAALPLGTRRLVELGRALALEPSVLLLDEVASGLDRDEVKELAVVIRRLSAAGATIVLVEHNFDLIQAVADEVFVLAEGRLLAHGTAAEIAVDESVRDTYLGAGPSKRSAKVSEPVEEARA